MNGRSGYSKTIEYVLVPDSTSARRLRRLLAARAPRLGLVVGTWAELLTLAANAYAVPAKDNNWDERLRAAAQTVVDPFWARSFEVAPNEVVDHLDNALRNLLHAGAAGELLVASTSMDGISPRAVRHLRDLFRLHQQMGSILPADLAITDRISRTDASSARFAIHLYRHEQVPCLSYRQSALADKINADFATPAAPAIQRLLAELFDATAAATTGQRSTSALRHLQNNLFAPYARSVSDFTDQSEKLADREQMNACVQANRSGNLHPPDGFATDSQKVRQAPGRANLDSSLQWLALRDYREEITTAVAMIRQLLADDATMTWADIAILLPDTADYTVTLAHELHSSNIPCSGLPGKQPVRDLGGELLRNFIATLQPPAATMASAALFSSPLMPWSMAAGTRMGQNIMNGHGYPDDNPVTELLTNPPDTAEQLIATLHRLLDIIRADNTTARHRARMQQLVTELIATLATNPDINWMQLERQLAPQQLCNDVGTSYHQQGVTIFLADREPWRHCRVLLVLGLAAGQYPPPPAISPFFSAADINAINNILPGQLTTSQQLLQRRRALFKRQLCTATDEITFFIPRRDGCGTHLETAESLIFMAQLFVEGAKVDTLLCDTNNAEHRSKIRHLVYTPKTAPAQPQLRCHQIPASLDLEHDLLAQRCDKDGRQKPESPSGLETLMVSPLAWLLHRYHMEPQPWQLDTLDVMTRGSLAHRVFEHLFTPGQAIPAAATITTQIPLLLAQAAQEIFPLLQRDEWRIERRNLQRELTVAAQRWREILTEIKATIVGVEIPLNGTFDDIPIAGIADLLLQLPGNRLLVVDYKKSGSSARIKRMEKGYDSQANLYRIMLKTGDNHLDVPVLQQASRRTGQISIMYYLLNDQTALSDSDSWTSNAIAGWHEMGATSADNAMDLLHERIAQLRQGKIVLNHSAEKTQLEKETGITPYAFDNSPLIGLFMLG